MSATFVTIAQIARVTGRHPGSVLRALKAVGKKPAREPGVHGLRMPLSEANDFAAKQWPGSRKITLADLSVPTPITTHEKQ